MYRVQLAQFTGPLDLLLQLIEKEEMNITQISLAQVADQYLDYMNQIENLSSRDIADFLEIAARLILVKSKALLPQLELSEDEELSAEELALRLQEYKKFKQAGQGLRRLLDKKQYSFGRQIFLEEEAVFSPPPDLTAETLRATFAAVLGAVPQADYLEEEVMVDVVSMEDKIEHIKNTLTEKINTCFHKLHDAKSKMEVIVTFLAMLELMKQRIIDVKQDEVFGEIELKKI